MLVGKLNGLALPPEPRFMRDEATPKASQLPGFGEQYDYHTLFYDAVHLPKQKKICLICPALLNLEKVIRGAIFSSAAGTHQITSIRTLARYSEVWLDYSGPLAPLRFHFADVEATFEPSAASSDLFGQLNCAVLKNKDNDLAWIRDWARYHVAVHNLQGVLIFDNNSTAYSADDLASALGGVPGLKQLCVIPAPFPFGMVGVEPKAHASLFLQVALLNIARLRFMSAARAVLVADVDEMIAPMGRTNIFDRTVGSLTGYTRFRGQWCDAPAREKVRHADHIYADQPCLATKYCLCPTRLWGFKHWDIHSARRKYISKVGIRDDIKYWHFRKISTSWKYLRSGDKSPTSALDPELKALLERALPDHTDIAPHDMKRSA